MSDWIEDYAIIGDCQTAALISRSGSIDWLCLPRFDSGACFAALLGSPDHGRWLLRPASDEVKTTRRYRDGTLVLETEHQTPTGTVVVTDCMPPRTSAPDLLRVVECKSGQVPMHSQLVLRFDYGTVVPWVTRAGNELTAIAGPDLVHLRTTAPMRGENMTTVSDFTVTAGERVAFDFTWHPSNRPAPPTLDVERAVEETVLWWERWARRCSYEGPWRNAVVRSLVTLKGLTYAPTGGIVAAATTSLPEHLGGVRNWDYRICWLRDATFTLYALTHAGYEQEARAWRGWLLRAVAGDPSRLQIMYGLAGERRLTELELEWLPGYEGSTPVRIGNAAHGQFQLDVYGELLDATLHCRRELQGCVEGWNLERALLVSLESLWQQPDEGIWEVRGPRQQFTHSKVMAWVAVDRGIKAAEMFKLDGPVERWRELRDRIHAEVCERGYDAERGAFVQAYGSKNLDASLLMIPLVGFLPPTNPRVRGTVEAIERHLVTDGFVARYATEHVLDGLPAGEGAFLACSFWLADNLALLGRTEEARELFERLLAVRNDVGLLAEEYDPRLGRQLGNFPQAFSHVGLVNTAYNLTRAGGPAERRRAT